MDGTSFRKNSYYNSRLPDLGIGHKNRSEEIKRDKINQIREDNLYSGSDEGIKTQNTNSESESNKKLTPTQYAIVNSPILPKSYKDSQVEEISEDETLTPTHRVSRPEEIIEYSDDEQFALGQKNRKSPELEDISEYESENEQVGSLRNRVTSSPLHSMNNQVSPVVNEDEYEVVQIESDVEELLDSKDDTNAQNEFMNDNRDSHLKTLSLKTLNTNSAHMSFPIKSGPKVQVVGNNIFGRVDSNNNNNTNNTYLKMAISPNSKMQKGSCVYRICQTDAQGNILENASMYIGGTERSCLEAGKEMARSATDPKNRQGEKYRRVCDEVFKKSRFTIPRNLNAEFDAVSKIRIQVVKKTSNVWRETEIAIENRAPMGIQDWNMKKDREEQQRKRASDPLAENQNITNFFQQATQTEISAIPAPVKRKIGITDYFKPQDPSQAHSIPNPITVAHPAKKTKISDFFSPKK